MAELSGLLTVITSSLIVVATWIQTLPRPPPYTPTTSDHVRKPRTACEWLNNEGKLRL